MKKSRGGDYMKVEAVAAWYRQLGLGDIKAENPE